jgi:hypothetical protein
VEEKRLPQSLRPEASVEKNQLYGERHVSLCEQFPGTEALVSAISPCLGNVEEKIASYKKAEKESLKANDKQICNTNLLKNQLRSTSERIKEYDRDNPGSNLMSMVFPDNLTPVVLLTNPEDLLSETTTIVAKIQSLGSEHPLYAIAAKITEKVDICNQCMAKCKEADAKLNMAETELDIAHLALVKQYGINILESKKMFGNDFTEQLFPRLVAQKKSAPPSPPSPAKISVNEVAVVAEPSEEYSSQD